MKKSFILLSLFLVISSISFGALLVDYQLTSGSLATVYNLGDATLIKHVSGSDLLNGNTGTITAGGFHGATVGDISNLTNGTWDSNGLTVIAADNAYPVTSFQGEWTISPAKDIMEIVVFSGHDNVGRGWINFKVEVDTGSGYTLLTDEAKTGDYEQVQPDLTTMVGYVSVYNSTGGSIAYAVSKLRITFYPVSHNSSNFFQKYDDLHAPTPNNYPNQGTVLKEIDVIESTAVGDWNLY
jgi:hypothetical protein